MLFAKSIENINYLEQKSTQSIEINIDIKLLS